MAREKIGEICGIDLIVDDDLPDDTMVLHDAKEAVAIKDGRAAKIELKDSWARESRLAGRGLLK
jgi:hypothetical protein